MQIEEDIMALACPQSMASQVINMLYSIRIYNIKIDASLFTFYSPQGVMFLLVYVDGLILIGNNNDMFMY